MNEGKENIIIKKSHAFALEIISIYKFLVEKKEYVLSKQLLRSGTSIGANIHEGVASVSKKDFVNKLGIAVKETIETLYWLNLLKDSHYITEEQFAKTSLSCEEIRRILNSIILTTKERYLSKSDIHNS
jgi:four helix bundle protein